MAQRARKKPPLKVQAIPPPVGGWNARDLYNTMDDKDALVLDNWIPDVSAVRVRGGSVAYATGLPSYVDTLMEFSTTSGVYKLLAGSDDSLYDISSAGAVGDPIKTDLTNVRFGFTQFAAGGGDFLCMVNGADGYFTWDGTTLTDRSADITGATASTFKSVTQHQSRLWFIPANSKSVFYLPADSIQGAASEFPLGSQMTLGGAVIAMGSWTRDGGSGMDDFAVFVTNRGEVIIYQGTDPDVAGSWSLVGRFKIAEPVGGDRCIVKAGADLAIMTAQGVIPLSNVLQVGEAGQETIAFTDKIVHAFRAAYSSAGANFGWGICEFPSQGLVISNVPFSEYGTTYQFVANVRTGAWCRFTGLNAVCWSRFGNRLLFGGQNGTVYEYDPSIHTDDGAPIKCTYVSAVVGDDNPGNKQYLMARPRVRAPAGFLPRVVLRINRDETPVPIQANTAEDIGGLWDVAMWDVATWGVPLVSTASWQNVGGIGTFASFAFSVTTKTDLQYEGGDLTYQTGGLLG